MKKVITLLLILVVSFANAQTNTKISNSHFKSLSTEKLISLETDKIFDKLIKIRRNLHENPELAGNETQTQETIKQYLLSLGLEVKTGIYGHSVVGILKGVKKGKNIAWRSDMDALPSNFPDKVNFKSKTQGIQHGCGHDIHMTIALGIAEVLSKNKKDLHGTVYFIFQPEEETFVGAKKMLEQGLFATLKPDEIYGFHITALPVGQLMVKANEVFAYQKGLRIQLKNTLSKEEITELTAKINNALFRISGGSKPWEIQQMIDQKIGLSNPNTIFQDYCITGGDFVNYTKNDTLFLEVELYETEASNLKNIIPTIKKTIAEQNYTDRLLSVSFIKENPTVLNDPKLTETAIKTLDDTYGKGYITADYGQIPFFNDDFAYFQQKIPGVYFFLGGSNFEKEVIAMNHAPNFEVDEECIRVGVKSFSTLIFNRMNEK